MDSDSIRLILILGLLVLTSSFFSASETAFTSANRIRLKNEADTGDKKAALALSLTDDYDNVLSTILVGNNLVNILASSLATLLFVRYFPVIGITLSTIVMTVLVLIFGEISPKTIAKESPEKFTKFSSPVLRVLMVVLTPVNWLFSNWKKILNKIFHFEADPGISEQELLTLVDEAQHGGGIDSHEHELIRSAIEFNDLEAGSIITPRVDVVAAEVTDSKEEIEDMFYEHGYSRILIFEETIDNVVGVIHQKDFYMYLKNSYLYHSNESIQSIVKPVAFAPPNMKIPKLLKILQNMKSHMAVVTDEYGGTMGIVTLEDILEELVGEIWDEHDEVVTDVMKLSEREYKISGNASLDKLLEMFAIDDEFVSNSVSGFVIEELGKVPAEGDSFVYQHVKFTVTKVGFRRVLEVFAEVLEFGQAESFAEDSLSKTFEPGKFLNA